MTKDDAIESIKSNVVHRIKFALTQFPEDRDMFFLAVKHGHSLGKCPEKFQDDPEIVFEALKSSPHAFPHIPEKMKTDRKIVSFAIDNHFYVLRYLSEDLKNDKQLVLQAFLVQKKLDTPAIYKFNQGWLLNFLGKELSKEIGRNNPLQYLQSYFSHETLNKKLPVKKYDIIKKTKI